MPRLTRLAEGCNAFRLQFDPDLLAPVRRSFEQHIAGFLNSVAGKNVLAGGRPHQQPVPDSEGHYYLTSYGIHPLLWLASDDIQTHALYDDFFQALSLHREIASLVDCEHDPVVYCGFLVVSNRSVLPNWHVDYQPGANAYTLLTPLEALDSGHGHLRYRDRKGDAVEYRYRLGEALMFGEGFIHATQPFRPNPVPRVLLSLTVGTDRMAYWPVLSRTIATQSRHLMLPNRNWARAEDWQITSSG